jgi:hypothetical protein
VRATRRPLGSGAAALVHGAKANPGVPLHVVMGGGACLVAAVACGGLFRDVGGEGEPAGEAASTIP